MIIIIYVTAGYGCYCTSVINYMAEINAIIIQWIITRIQCIGLSTRYCDSIGNMF
jgi:hypothetical protein